MAGVIQHAQHAGGGIEQAAQAGAVRQRRERGRGRGLGLGLCQPGAQQARTRLVGETGDDLVATAQGVQQGDAQTPRLARGALPTRQGQRMQMAQTLALVAVHPQQLATPRLPVSAQAMTVQG
jgi:hypothetical protein